jgi:SAM-dependent methyltransferase
VTDAADYDPRIVDLYDLDNPDGPDHDYYRSLAVDAAHILDVGCGTGILTVTLPAPGRTVVGLDPSPAMLAYARSRPGAGRVTWIDGDTRALPGERFDLILMSGNVAQHIPHGDWERTLGDLRAVAAPGATLAFESRNPDARAWESWVQEVPSVRDTAHGPLTEWSAVEERADGTVLLRAFNRFEDTGETVVVEEVLVFRSRDGIEADLRAAGFEVTAVWGDWVRTPFDGQRIMVFEARPVAQR